ncbi:MAG: DUF362 domain-containing protein [Acidobacteriota bacterium]
MEPSRKFSDAGGMSRREFGHRTGLSFLGLLSREHGRGSQEKARVPVALCTLREPGQAVERALDLLGKPGVAGRHVYLKASYNSADPFPASTHPSTLRAVARVLRDLGCLRISLVERSGMGTAGEIWQELRMDDALKGLDVRLVSLDDLAPGEWKHRDLPESDWKHGVRSPAFLTGDACVVQLCNLKTHRFGGTFSASLKNSLGLIAKRGIVEDRPYNYMEEMHASPSQRRMIADVNRIYQPALVIMDAGQIFVDGGPEHGQVARPDLLLASRDRVAIDAAGVALLRIHGAGPALTRGSVFEQEQIQRAVELKLGVQSPEEMLCLAADRDCHRTVAQIQATLIESPGEEDKREGKKP